MVIFVDDLRACCAIYVDRGRDGSRVLFKNVGGAKHVFEEIGTVRP